MGTDPRSAASLRSAVMESEISGGRKRSASAQSHQNHLVEYANHNTGKVHDSTSSKALDYGVGGIGQQLMLTAPPVPHQPIQQSGGFEEAEQPVEQPDYGADAARMAEAGIDIKNRPREPTESIGGQPAVRVPTVDASETQAPLALDAPQVHESQVVRYHDLTAEPEVELVNRAEDSVHQDASAMLNQAENSMANHDIQPTHNALQFEQTVGTSRQEHAAAGDHPDIHSRHDERPSADVQPESRALTVAHRTDRDHAANAVLGDRHRNQSVFGDHTVAVKGPEQITRRVPYHELSPDQLQSLPAEAFDQAQFALGQRRMAVARGSGVDRGPEFKRGHVQEDIRRHREDARRKASKMHKNIVMGVRRPGLDPKVQNQLMHGSLPNEPPPPAMPDAPAGPTPTGPTINVAGQIQDAKRAQMHRLINIIGTKQTIDEDIRMKEQQAGNVDFTGSAAFSATGSGGTTTRSGTSDSAATWNPPIPGQAAAALSAADTWNPPIAGRPQAAARAPDINVAGQIQDAKRAQMHRLTRIIGTKRDIDADIKRRRAAVVGGINEDLAERAERARQQAEWDRQTATDSSYTESIPDLPGAPNVARQIQDAKRAQMHRLTRIIGTKRDIDADIKRKRAGVVGDINADIKRQRAGVVDEINEDIRRQRAKVVDNINQDIRDQRQEVVEDINAGIARQRQQVVDDINADLRRRGQQLTKYTGPGSHKPDIPHFGHLGVQKRITGPPDKPPDKPKIPYFGHLGAQKRITGPVLKPPDKPPDKPKIPYFGHLGVQKRITGPEAASVGGGSAAMSIEAQASDAPVPTVADVARRVRFDPAVGPPGGVGPPGAAGGPGRGGPVAAAGYGRYPRQQMPGRGPGGQQSGQQQAPVTVTTQGGHGASASSAGTGGQQQRAPIIVQAPKKKAAPKKAVKKGGAKKAQTGVTSARKKYTAKRKSKLAELRSSKAKRIREFNTKTKKLPAAERKKRRADFKRKVNAQYKNIVSKFPTARGMTNVQQLQRLIKQAESIRA